MTAETNEFISALAAFVAAEMAASDEPADYNHDSVRIVDARNALFQNVGRRGTDEEQDVYAMRSLCRIDEVTMEVVPDRGRLASLARNYFG